MGEFIFGYGSLAGQPGDASVLGGYRRWWGVAMDNSRTIPGYKCYLDEAGARPPVYVAFLDLREAAGESVNGFVFEVPGAELPALDERERNYRRTEVSESISPAPAGRVWAYLGASAARARRRAGLEAGSLVVTREYVERVEARFEGLGQEAVTAYRRSTDEPPCPVADLRRVDLPPG